MSKKYIYKKIACIILAMPFTIFSISNVMAQGPGWSNANCDDLEKKCNAIQDIKEACKVFQVIGQEGECLAHWNYIAPPTGIPKENAKENTCKFAANKGFNEYKCLR